MWFTYGLLWQPPPLANKDNAFQIQKRILSRWEPFVIFFPLPNWELKSVSHFTYLRKWLLSQGSLSPTSDDKTSQDTVHGETDVRFEKRYISFSELDKGID